MVFVLYDPSTIRQRFVWGVLVARIRVRPENVSSSIADLERLFRLR